MTLSVEQKLAIHELLSRAAYAYDERDMKALEAGFAPEASMSLRIAGGDLIGPFEGRPAILELMRNSMAQQSDVRRHVVSNIFFDESEKTEHDPSIRIRKSSFQRGRMGRIQLPVQVFHP